MAYTPSLIASRSSPGYDQGTPHHDAHSLSSALAAIIQDLAAFAGIFAIDTVERNALATELGYGVVSTAALSILGILGLLKSCFKLALGLELSRKSGFSVDSLRSVYGYMENESAAAGSLVNCDEIDVRFAADYICIRKTRQYFDNATRPILTVGNDFPYPLNGKTAINLGNPVQEMSLIQHPITIAVTAFSLSGVTSWLLAILFVGNLGLYAFVPIISLHLSLLSIVAIPLIISFRIDRPAQAITRSKLQALLKNDAAGNRMTFMQYPTNSGYALYFYKNIDFLQTKRFTLFVLLSSIACAASYTAQFIILKLSDATNAGIWVGCQAGLAALRLGYCILKRPYDHPNTHQTEYVVLENEAFDAVNLLSLSQSLPLGSHKIPLPIWNYLCSTKLTKMIEDAFQNSQNPPDLKAEDLFFINSDFIELMRFHAGKQSWPSTWTIALAISERDLSQSSTIKPILFIENPDLALNPSRIEAEARLTWAAFPKLPHREPSDPRPPRFNFEDLWCIARQRTMGFVLHKDLVLKGLDHGARANATDIGRRFLQELAFRREEKDVVKMFHCATAGVTPRDGEGYATRDPPYYAPEEPKSMKQALNTIQEYVDFGHSRRRMSRRHVGVFHPATAVISLKRKLQIAIIKTAKFVLAPIGLDLVYGSSKEIAKSGV